MACNFRSMNDAGFYTKDQVPPVEERQFIAGFVPLRTIYGGIYSRTIWVRATSIRTVEKVRNDPPRSGHVLPNSPDTVYKLTFDVGEGLTVMDNPIEQIERGV